MEFGSEFIYCGEDTHEVIEDIPYDNADVLDSFTERVDDGQTCMIEMLDTAGTEQFTAMRDLYMKNGEAFIIIYSIIARSTFNDVVDMRELILRIKDADTVPMVLVGNKTDLEDARMIDAEEGAQLARTWGCAFLEASAKTSKNVVEAVETLLRLTPRKGQEYKVVVLGSGGVGKSSFCIRFMQGIFVEKYDPTIEDSYRKMISVTGLPKESQKKQAKSGKSDHGPSSPKSWLGKIKNKFRSSTSLSGCPSTTTTTSSSTSSMLNKEMKTVPRSTTNVISVGLGMLAESSNTMTGDPVLCAHCGSCLSTFSVLKTIAENANTYNWMCDFCRHVNAGLQLEDAEIPKEEIIDYMLSPPPAQGTKDDAASFVVFCLDVSGSMCVTVEIPALQGEWKKLRTNRDQEAHRALNPEGAVQHLPAEKHGAQYMSRFQCMTAAVSEHILQLVVRHPERKVLLITFSNELTYYADCADHPVTIAGDALSSSQAIRDIANKITLDGIRPVQQSSAALNAKLAQITEDGATALGPAMLLASCLASRHPNSEIILCTDGLSNIGLGALDESDKLEGATKFYRELGTYAKSHKTTINIMALQGTDCALSSLAACATETSGSVNVLHPLEWVAEVQRIAQNPTIATNVHTRLLLPSILEGVSQAKSTCAACAPLKGANFICREVGNATAETDVTFEMKIVSPGSGSVSKSGSGSGSAQEVPKSGDATFQFQTTYTRLDGT